MNLPNKTKYWHVGKNQLRQVTLDFDRFHFWRSRVMSLCEVQNCTIFGYAIIKKKINPEISWERGIHAPWIHSSFIYFNALYAQVDIFRKEKKIAPDQQSVKYWTVPKVLKMTRKKCDFGFGQKNFLIPSCSRKNFLFSICWKKNSCPRKNHNPFKLHM